MFEKLSLGDKTALILLWACGILSYADLSGRLTLLGLVRDGRLTEAGRLVAARVVLEDPETTPSAKRRAAAQLKAA